MQAKQMQREQGRVKWFNAKGGYGFVTLLGADGQVQQSGVPRVGADGGHPRREVFVHHSGLKVGSEQFRYLVEGEYVELEVRETEGKGDNVFPRRGLGAVPRYQGVEVRGIGGGPLMCETRNESSASANEYKSNNRTREVGQRGTPRGVSRGGSQRHRPSAELE